MKILPGRFVSKANIAVMALFMGLGPGNLMVSSKALAAGASPSFWQGSANGADAPPDPPVGVIGVTTPGKGILIGAVTGDFSRTSGTNIGRDEVSNDFVANNLVYKYQPNEFLRIMPTAIFSPTVTFALAYGLTDNLGFSISSGYSHRDVMGLTYLGPKGVGIAGYNNMQAGGATDVNIAAVWRAYNDDMHTVSFGVGVSVPTGRYTIPFKLHATDGSLFVSRGFYGYQMGSGTIDVIPTAVYSGHNGPWGWGLSYMGVIPTENNSQDWRWGNAHAFSGWLAYRWTSSFSTSIRILGTTQGIVKGRDKQISGAAVSVATDNYGGQTITPLIGFSVDGKAFGFENTNLSFEAGAPFYQWLYGPQPRNSWTASISLKHTMDTNKWNLFQ